MCIMVVNLSISAYILGSMTLLATKSDAKVPDSQTTHTPYSAPLLLLQRDCALLLTAIPCYTQTSEQRTRMHDLHVFMKMRRTSRAQHSLAVIITLRHTQFYSSTLQKFPTT